MPGDPGERGIFRAIGGDSTLELPHKPRFIRMPRVTITVPDKNPQPYRFALDRKSVTLGRGSENDIVVDCGSISVHHAVMERIEGGYQLRDLGSTNGTKLNGKPQDKVELLDGLTVQIGDVDFHFTLTADEQMALAKERPDGESPIIKEETEEKPKRNRSPERPAPAPVASSSAPSAAANFFMTLLFFVLAAGAFFLGLSIRYSKENPGRSMVQDMKNGLPAEEAPADTEAASPDEETGDE